MLAQTTGIHLLLVNETRHSRSRGPRVDSVWRFQGRVLPASSSFWGLQALLDIPYLVAAALRSLLQVSWPSSPCVSKSPSIRTLVTGFRGHWSLDLGPTVTWFRLILTNHICKDPISKCGHILSFPVNVNFEGDIFQPGLVLIQNQRVFQNI